MKKFVWLSTVEREKKWNYFEEKGEKKLKSRDRINCTAIYVRENRHQWVARPSVKVFEKVAPNVHGRLEAWPIRENSHGGAISTWLSLSFSFFLYFWLLLVKKRSLFPSGHRWDRRVRHLISLSLTGRYFGIYFNYIYIGTSFILSAYPQGTLSLFPQLYRGTSDSSFSNN